MSLFGKILAVFNILAAMGFLALAGMDYSQRQNWSYAHFRHQLAIHGLPVTDQDDTWRLPGRTIASDLTKKALDDIFAPAGGNPVKTQVEAVTQAKQSVDAVLEQAGDNPQAKKLAIAQYLIPLAQTGDERELYQASVRDPKVTAETLKQQLDALITIAVGNQDRNGRERDLESRRRAIADLLYNLSPDANAAWHARVMAIVGLEHYVGAADRQAANFAQMADRLSTAISDEQATFVRRYQALVPELQTLSEQVKDLDARLKEQQELVQKHTALKNARQAEVADFSTKIQAATARVAQELATLQGLQRQLFGLQQELAAAQLQNQQLERQLRTRETGR